jgi:hypothetical protein
VFKIKFDFKSGQAGQNAMAVRCQLKESGEIVLSRQGVIVSFSSRKKKRESKKFRIANATRRFGKLILIKIKTHHQISLS